ncbi:molybdopterin converting factor subunit 1 [Fulvivirga ligni]|uniref:molybdopterin converting factor subunit 1 n=1 Tax=Fulvivirga ligni TaxID=2904246 RepID=UPI001F33ADB8|nr:molybdopterin converting factor subunit 1 [Fulvivirga ligni]UII23811.1 molybdopterin converting factor subunit 1 [Fulvivirga ligni]
MKLKILLFGITKDIIGSESHELTVDKKSAKVKDLRAVLVADYPDLEKLNSLMIAVNNEYAEDNQAIEETDEIALIPPVSGG